jgi:glutathione S-transferase
MSLTLVIGNKNFATWSLRPWLVLKQARIPFREELIRHTRPESKAQILAHSPSGKVPALHDGDLKIWDSLSICEYLAERFPEKKLWPNGVAARALARSITAEMHAGFQNLRTHCSLPAGPEARNFVAPPEVEQDVARLDAMWRDARSRFGKGGPFLFGEFTIADAFYAPVVARVRTFGLKLGTEAREYCDVIWSLPAMQEWVAAAQAEAAAA